MKYRETEHVHRWKNKIKRSIVNFVNFGVENQIYNYITHYNNTFCSIYKTKCLRKINLGPTTTSPNQMLT